ncbi:MAG: thiamine kinase-like enzyme [Parasphingorhabdus sp.]
MEISILTGGLNNTNLALTNSTGRYVLKIRPDDYQAFGADSNASITAQDLCARAGIAAQIICIDSDRKDFVSDFIEGTPLNPESYRQGDLQRSFITILKTLHGLSGEIRERSFFDDIRLFMVGTNRARVSIPTGFNRLLAKAYELEKLLSKPDSPMALCYNDLVPQNLMHNQSGLKLVDFDYAGYGWIAADLASAVSQFEMDEVETEKFLKLYDEGLDDGQRGRVAAYCYCNNIREIAFTLFAEPALAENTHVNGEINFTTHRNKNLEQAEISIQDPVFLNKCAAASFIRTNALF